MSLVAVHGPNTMYTTEGGGQALASSPVGMTATKDPTNGLKFSFSAVDQSRPAADYDWSFTGPGSPAAQPNVYNGTVTYTGAGAGTIVCTVPAVTATVTNKALASNVATLTMASAAAFVVGETVTVTGVDATFNGTYVITSKTATTISYAKTAADVTSASSTGTITATNPASGTYTITVGATAGTPRMVEQSAEPPTNGNGAYYPSDHTVDEVKTEADNNASDTAYIQALLDAERADKNRTTLVAYLEGLLPYVPGDHTVPDVVQHATDHPDELEALIAAEQAGKNRTTLLSQLEALRTT